MNRPAEIPRWLAQLDEADLVFVKRFVLTSGSLKQVAGVYKVSYPTVRRRLDRLIAKIEVLDDGRDMPSFERLLRAQFADGHLDEVGLRTLLAAYAKEHTKEDT